MILKKGRKFKCRDLFKMPNFKIWREFKV